MSFSKLFVLSFVILFLPIGNSQNLPVKYVDPEIINPDESAILTIGKTCDKVYPEQGKINIRLEMILTLFVDHRLIDGAIAAQFLEKLKK